MSDYQLIVIGAGPGGTAAALKAASLGISTVLVEKRDVGGTCLNRGCVPTKTLLHVSEIFHEAENGASSGIRIDGARMDTEALFAYKREICDKLRSGSESQLKSAGVTVLKGTASVTDGHTVRVVSCADDATVLLSADSILLASGSVPARPPIPGLDLPGVATSDELLEGMDPLPHSVLIMGGGVIGAEFAQFFSDLGVETSVIEGLDRLLPNMDRDLGQNLALILKKQGVKIFTGAMISRIETDGEHLKAVFSSKDGEASCSAETVLCAIGRTPYLEGIFPEDFRPEMDGRRIKVNQDFATSIPGIYAIGDVSSKIQLAHAASSQGAAFAEKRYGTSGGVRMDIVPGCVYCRPEIATVGLTEAEAKEAGIPVKTGKCVMFSNARTLISGDGRSFMKILAESESRRIVGAQLMCRNSSDMIGEISQAIAGGMTPDQLLMAMRPHPTFEEAMTDALEDLKKKLDS